VVSQAPRDDCSSIYIPIPIGPKSSRLEIVLLSCILHHPLCATLCHRHCINPVTMLDFLAGCQLPTHTLCFPPLNPNP